MMTDALYILLFLHQNQLSEKFMKTHLTFELQSVFIVSFRVSEKFKMIIT